MLRKVLWLALACAVLLAALALSRQVRFTGAPEKPKAPSAEEAAKPVAAKAPEKVVEAPPPPPTPEELQMQEDAAATGMTTVEPAPQDEPAAKTPDQPPPK